ncbi:MAG: hypothetical protein JNJ55_00235 [Betaproteobacteria bacterium]|nr:hypothetical protein [Betaproteobacteria bacterium]
MSTPLLETFLAMQRISLSAAESLAALNADAVRVMARQAAAAHPLPRADALVPWVLHEAAKVPPALSESLQLSRRAAAICSTTMADWLGVCAKHTAELNAQSLDAAETLSGLLTQDADGLHAEAKQVRERLDTAHRAYQNMLTAFCAASEAFAGELPPDATRTNKRTRA